MKKYIFPFLIFTLLTGCGQKNESDVKQPEKIVVTQSVAKADVVKGYDYIGVVKAKDTKNYSFLMAGKIQEICVEKGQSFKKGDILAKLDATTLKYSSNINSNSTNQAQAGMEKAEDTYDTNIANAEKNIAALQTGIEAGQKGIDAAQGRITTGQKEIDAAQERIETGKKEIEAGEKGIEALERALVAAQTNLDAGQEALNTLKNQLDAAREINKAGGLADLDLQALESQYEQKLAEYDTSKAKYDGSKAELEQKRAALESSRTELKQNQAKVESSKAELKQNQAAIEKSKAELTSLKTQKITAEKTLQNLKVSKEKDLQSAKATVDSAKTNEDITKKNINDTVVKAEADGYVMELPYKEGEVIAAGYPVVVAKSKELVVTVGVSDKEYPDIKLGQQAIINEKIKGTVETIAQYPNEDTRTYAVDIAIPEGKLTIGETVNAKLVTGSEVGCYVPINSIFNIDGVDYVYTVNDKNKVHRKQVTRGEILGDTVRIEIDDPTAIIVTEDIKGLRENDSVALEGEEKKPEVDKNEK